MPTSQGTRGIGPTPYAAAGRTPRCVTRVSRARPYAPTAKALLKDALFELHAGTQAFIFGNAHCDLLVAAVMERI